MQAATAILAEIAAWSMAALGALLFLCQLIAREIGYALGRRRGAPQDGEGVGVLVGAMLALLAFVLALSVAFANGWYVERRAGAIAEANAIGTAWLRAEAIGEPRGDAVARLLERYAEVRVAFVQAGDLASADTSSRQTAALQGEIWGHVAALVRERPDAVAASLMAAVNEVFDASTEERFAFRFALPDRLLWLLLSMTVVAMAGLGYQLGQRGQAHRALAMMLTLLWTLVIMFIIDMGAARLGTLRTSVEAYEWTIQGFQGGVLIPPLAPR